MIDFVNKFELEKDLSTTGGFEIRSHSDVRFSQRDLSVFLLKHQVSAPSITRIWGLGELSLDGSFVFDRLHHLAIDLRIPKGISSSVSLCPQLRLIDGGLKVMGPCLLPALHTVLGDIRFSADARIPSLRIGGGEVVGTNDGYPENLVAAGGRVWVSTDQQVYESLRFVGRDVSQANSVTKDSSVRRSGHADCAEFMGRDAAIEAGRRWLELRDVAHAQLARADAVLDAALIHEAGLSL